MTNEFDLIAEIVNELEARARSGTGVVLGVGDDAAVLQPSPGMQLVATTDNLVAGRHFVDTGENRADPDEIGHLALAANLSDLAAMGATPRWCLLTLSLPEANSQWMQRFLQGFLGLADDYDCALVGGNITRGPLNIGVTALGEVPYGRYATREGASVGQRVVVTGTLGDAGAGLKLAKAPGNPLRERLLKPSPRIAAGLELAGFAQAMIDISDGLLADLKHLTGDLGASVQCSRLPTSHALIEAIPDQRERWRLQFSGGDYELLALVDESAKLPDVVGGVKLTEIGQITDTGRIECLDAEGGDFEAAESGWDHFT